MRVVRIAPLILASVVLTACIASPRVRHHDGFAHWRADPRAMEKTFSVSLGPMVLGLARRFADDDDARHVLRDLDAVRVSVYSVKESVRVSEAIETTANSLRENGWEPVVRVRDDDEETLVMTQAKNDRIAGMMVMSVESDEVVMVNLVGDLRPSFFGEYLAELDIPQPTAE